MRAPIRAACLAAILLGLGCQTYRDQLSRSQGYYEQNQYELALAVLRNLERDQDALDDQERARYCYLRGMTDYRLEYRADARYWLGLARAAESQTKGALAAEELARLDKALGELNAAVYGTATPGLEPATQQRCQWSSECNQNQICESGRCVAIQ